MKAAALVAAVAACVSIQPAHAQEDPSAIEDGFYVKPVLLDSDGGTGSTLGVEYKLKGVLWSTSFDTNDAGEPDLNLGVGVGGAKIAYDAGGTIAASADRNPKDFLDALISLSATYFRGDLGAGAVGAFVKVESDQKFDNTQFAWGARATGLKQNILNRHDYLGLDLNYGQVDPGDDKDRKAALGVTSLKAYNRIDFEALYHYETGWRLVETIELNYRYFDEQNAPAAIRAAKLDKHHLATVRLGLPQGLFVAYSEGKLPFDRKKDQIFEIGLSYKLF